MAKIFWKQNGVPVGNNLKLFIHRVRRGPKPSPYRRLVRRRPLSRPGSQGLYNQGRRTNRLGVWSSCYRETKREA